MRRTIVSLVLLASAGAQIKPDPNAQWREQITAAEKDPYDLQPLKAALRIAEPFGTADLRLFETLVRLAAACSDDEEQDCGPKQGGYLNRAFEMRAKVKPVDAHFATLLVQLASAAASDPDRYRDAIILYGEAREIDEKLFGPSDQSVADIYAAEAWVYQYQKDQSQARRTMNYALEIREKAGASQSEKYADLLHGSARLYGAADDRSSSERQFRAALAIRERLWKRTDPRLAAYIKALADENGFQKNSGLSGEMYGRVVDLQRSVHSAKSEEYYKALLDLANFLKWQKQPADAQARFEEALQVSRQLHNQTGAAFCLEQIARCRIDRDQYKEAAEAAEASLVLRKQIGPPSARPAIVLYSLLAEAYLRAREEKKSAACFATLSEKATSDSRTLVSQTAEKLSAIYQERGDYPHAAEKLEQELASLEMMSLQNGAVNNPQIPQVMLRLAQLYQTMGRTEDANRMTFAALRMVASEGMKAGKISPIRNQILLGLAVFFVLAPLVGVVVCGFAYRVCARRVDRKLSLLYIPPPEKVDEPVIEPLPEPSSFGFATPPSGDISAFPIQPVAEPLIVSSLEERSVLTTAPPPVQELQPLIVPVFRVLLLAEGDVLFAIRVLNLLLSLLTLGTYSFWGKAKVRRYVCGQAEFDGDRFAFHGTGKELLLGWLRALPVLAFIFLFPNILPLVWQHKYSAAIAQLSAAAAFLLLWPIARVGAYRYRLNRMSWRGIRFSYRASALRFLGASLAGGFLSLLTLGFYVPFLQVRLRRLLFGQTYFGDRVFEFSGRAGDLLPAWLFAFPVSICSLGIGWAWWSALRHRYYWANTTCAGARFRCTVSGRKLLWLWVGNFLIIVPTLGLGISWAMLRTLRFWTEHIELVGQPELNFVRQDARASSALGESFADFLGFDFGF